MKLLGMINQFSKTLEEFSSWRYRRGLDEFTIRIEADPWKELNTYNNNELYVLSKYVGLRRESALILSALLIIYNDSGSETFMLNFISTETVLTVLCLSFGEFPNLEEAILDLEIRGMIAVYDMDFELIELIADIDRYLNLPKSRSIIPAYNQRYELTETFINKIRHI